jgi:hypothetical protein
MNTTDRNLYITYRWRVDVLLQRGDGKPYPDHLMVLGASAEEALGYPLTKAVKKARRLLKEVQSIECVEIAFAFDRDDPDKEYLSRRELDQLPLPKIKHLKKEA